jgi:hypothetical protein
LRASGQGGNAWARDFMLHPWNRISPFTGKVTFSLKPFQLIGWGLSHDQRKSPLFKVHCL